jgi:formylglycine-generating enzyme required for sulfatase activity
MMKSKMIMAALLVLAVFTANALERIAVFPFEDLDNALTRNETIFLYREFSNEFTNRSAGKFTVVPRQEVDRLINTEAAFQMTAFSAQAKTAEMERVLNGTQILSGVIGRVGNNIRVNVSLYTYPELAQLPGGTSLSVRDTGELFYKIPELVQNMQNNMTGGTSGTTPGRAGSVPEGFVRIEGGTFTMGSDSSEVGRSSNETQRRVTISPFHMSKHQVTQAEWEEIMGTNPSHFRGFNLPVERVSWLDAVDYCSRRSIKEGLTPAYTISGTNVTWNRQANGYRLPTEAEWEYACRAGTTTPFNTGFNITTAQANYYGNHPYNNNARGTYRERTMPVGSFAPNAWGLYDMHGNVWEWCWDWFGEYGVASQTDPIGPASGSHRVLRGGALDVDAAFLP